MKQNFNVAMAQADLHKEIPFPETEFAQRLSRVRQEMIRQGFTLLFLTSPEAIYYLSGFQCEWYQAQSGRGFPPTSGIAVHVDHDQYIHFETPSEALLTAIGTVSVDVRIFPLNRRRDGISFILEELRGSGWLKGTVGLELYNYRPNPVIAQRIQQAFSAAGLQVRDGTDVVRAVRHVKSALEMEAMEEAARIADIGMAAARDAILPGVTELEVFGAFVSAMAREGGEFPAILPPVMSGFRSHCLHPLASRKQIRRGERVNVDLCGVYKRYHCNISRGFWVGDPPDAVVDLHNRSIGVYPIIERLMRPGLNIRQFLSAVEDYYKTAGILDDCYWSGGYELGIAFPPDWVGPFIYDLSMTGAEAVFQPMTVVNHECNFFQPGGTGMSTTIETILFYEHVAVFACQSPREIQVV